MGAGAAVIRARSPRPPRGAVPVPLPWRLTGGAVRPVCVHRPAISRSSRVAGGGSAAPGCHRNGRRPVRWGGAGFSPGRGDPGGRQGSPDGCQRRGHDIGRGTCWVSGWAV